MGDNSKYLDDKVLEEPMVIKAIGADTLHGAITMPGSYIDKFKSAGYEVSVKSSDEVYINKDTGIYNFNFIRNLE